MPARAGIPYKPRIYENIYTIYYITPAVTRHH